MPIAQIIVAPRMVAALATDADKIMNSLKLALVEGLSTDERLVQITITAALCAPVGCEILCLVHHRAAEGRTEAVRAATAQNLHNLLHESLNGTVRVRLIAVDQSQIAAFDSQETL